MNSRFYVYFFLLVLGLGCVNSEILPVDYPLDDPSESIVTSSIFITVVDINEEPVADAVVQLDNQFFTTDEFGTCFVQDLEMPERAYFTVEKNGFFKGSRRLYATEGQIQYGEIVLMAKEEIGSFAASSGGQIDIDHAATVEFPSEALMLEDGTPYHGQVHVTGYAIRGDDPDLSVKMPGRLEGRNWNGDRGVLTSYGMIALEMHSPNGEKLELKAGQKADFRMDVPEAMRSGAPADIPMWYFDEEAGEWQLDGFAQFDGTGYETQLSHFSIWNCDVWDETMNWSAQFVDESGNPLSNLKFCMTILSSKTRACGQTNSEGSIFETLPDNELIKLELFDGCDNKIYNKEIGPYLENTSYGTATVAFGQGVLSTLTGVGLDCIEEPIKNGYAIVTLGNKHFISPINPADGIFHTSFLNCTNGSPVVIVVDKNTLKRSEPQQYSFSTEIDAGTLRACEDREEFLNLSFQGFPGAYSFQSLTVNYKPEEERTYFVADDGSFSGMYLKFDFECNQPGICSIGDYRGVISLPTGQIVFAVDLQVEITEYGPVGGEVKGELTGVLNGGGNGQGGPGFTDFTGVFSYIRK